MGALLSSFAAWLFGAMGWAVQAVWAFLFQSLEPIVAPLLLSALEALPDLGVDFASVDQILLVANYWLPLSEMFVLIASYLTFVIAAGAIRTVIKLIPTVG